MQVTGIFEFHGVPMTVTATWRADEGMFVDHEFSCDVTELGDDEYDDLVDAASLALDGALEAQGIEMSDDDVETLLDVLSTWG